MYFLLTFSPGRPSGVNDFMLMSQEASVFFYAVPRTQAPAIATRRRSISDRAAFSYCSGKLGYGSLQCHIPRGGERRQTLPAHRRLHFVMLRAASVSEQLNAQDVGGCLSAFNDDCLILFGKARAVKYPITRASVHFSKLPTTLKEIWTNSCFV